MRLLFLLALLNSALYCCLLPLWEGFDEPFHYAYVESLSANRQIPTLKQTTISAEIHASLNIVPISFILKRNIPGTIAFEDWFAFSPAERAKRVQQLQAIPSKQRKQPSTLLNYEAQQTPLAYLLLTPFDTLLSQWKLPARILVLRLLSSLTATVLIFWACIRLSGELGLLGPFRLLFLAVFFEMQIFAAAVCHIANDWLSITAGAWFLALLAALVNRARVRDAYSLGFIIAIGLLAKAYFLAFLPVFLAALAYLRWRSRLPSKTVILSLLIPIFLAGPWYGRNLLLYKAFAGLQEQVDVSSRWSVLQVFLYINWPRTLLNSARWSLWTGNESHLAFSRLTLDLELLLIVAALILFALQIRKSRSIELWTLLAALLFIAALLYDLCVAASFQPEQTTTGPYYAPCILPALLALACLGLQRSETVGQIIAVVWCLLSAWIATLTYIAKLIPYYGGFIGRSTLGSLWHWWTNPNGRTILAATTLAPAEIVYVLLICFLLALALLTAQTVRALANYYSS